ncbi:hypothetical protein MKX03_031438, partial [Papaver bracteatum]
MLIGGIKLWAPNLPIRTAVVELSSPVYGLEMHVSQFRSAITGDTMARMLEFSNVKVCRRNYVFDFGKQV